MTPCNSPVRDVSGQDDNPDSTTIPENQQQQQQQQHPEKFDEPRRVDHPTSQLSVHGEPDHTAAELEGLSLDIDTFTKGKNEVVEAVGDDDEDRMNAGPGLPVPYLDDSEGASQTSSEESWASFPSSGSNSTDGSSSDAEEEEGEEEEEVVVEQSAPGASAADASLPSPAAAFKFHEEFYGGAVEDTGGPLSPIEEEFTMGEDGAEEDLPYPIDTGPWMSRAIPRWAFLRSSNSLPTLGLGPEDFYHGGSALRHEVSPEEVEGDEERKGPPDEDGESSGCSRVIATVGSVYL